MNSPMYSVLRLLVEQQKAIPSVKSSASQFTKKSSAHSYDVLISTCEELMKTCGLLEHNIS